MTRRLSLALLLNAFLLTALNIPLAWTQDRPWTEYQPQSTETIAHAPWQTFLKKYLVASASGETHFAYSKVTPDDRQSLKRDIDRLTALPINHYTRDEQLAFWINLYNAVTVRVVLDHYPVSSIRKIGGSLFSPGPWSDKLVRVLGKDLSLDDIEHRILRPIWRDARLHYALNCASVGCPNLSLEAYQANRLNTQLDNAARSFVNHPRAVKIDGDRLIVSSIYDWYKGDFGGSDAAIITHLTAYAAPDLAQGLAGTRKIADHHYDWALNEPR